LKIMFLGTSSNAGKTTLDALFCRYLTRKGIDVVPFKASNLSLNSIATADGGEIGMGQAFQAWACGIEPCTDMNPVLLKPSRSGVLQVIMDGKAVRDISPGCLPDTTDLRVCACNAFDRLAHKHQAVICEGSGSPAELNLMDRDIANTAMIRARSIPSVLVGDIERGGVFAALYGTWLLLGEADRRLIKGFIINRFRGDPVILKSGIERIESLTGMGCLGVVPYVDLRFPEEDALSESKGKLRGDDAKQAFLENLDEMLDDVSGHLDFEALERIARQ
jgi:adenosylcobyric acid synthase